MLTILDLVLTSHFWTAISKVCRQFFAPTPVSTFHSPHPPSDLTQHCPHSALPLPFPFNIGRHEICLAFYPPLRSRILDPPHRLYRPSTPAPVGLLVFRCMAVTAPKQLSDLLHAHVGRERRKLGFIDALVLRSVVMLVFRKLGPHPTVDAITETGNKGSGR